ncbi:dihydrodipicolinate synthase family protein [Fictibacillus sp. WQ 8-8]|uniref:dihydrodipicolinate synthase family protein n=1 Tax=Fictibacillus sp. WQ 8-8 TaxID=2938788 RepID=UPI002108A9CF|nr:dihydrodipicolinate synthase family protein [Fictibacillus sp. WQ 8-8]MCQ6266704.1 dihydrodipicolinate synthase family protein [Fictibacillus sp. WQ 8-8]
MSAKFQGVIPPIPTILHKDGRLDEKGMGNLIDFLIESKVDGLFFLGTGGEFSQMTVELRKAVTEFAIQYVNCRVPVLIGTGTPSTLETISLSMHAKEAGADGIVVINPYYWQLTEENLFQHYADIAEAIDLPILLYNFPGLTGQDLSPEFVLKLVKAYPNIAGIKETVESVGHTREMILTVKSFKEDFAVLSGYDDHLLNTLSVGGDGAIPLTANFIPELTVGLYQSFKEGNYGKAIELHKKLAPFPLLYKLDSPFVNVAKEAIRMRGIEISTDVLAPARPLSAEKKEQIQRCMDTVLNQAIPLSN